MKLHYTYSDICKIIIGKEDPDDSLIQEVSFDSRKIVDGRNVLFFAFKGEFRDGSDFIIDAYSKGVRHFVVEQIIDTTQFEGAQFLSVSNVLESIQKLAAYHRSQFKGKVVAITGSNGKTIVKEWLSTLLIGQYHIARTPKSYNSQLGVALSILEITKSTDIAIIEAGISKPNEMDRLWEMIRPTHGILTHIGSAHLENFLSVDELIGEKLKLFQKVEITIAPANLNYLNGVKTISREHYQYLISLVSFNNEHLIDNAVLAIAMAEELGVDPSKLERGVKQLQPLTMRMESFNGNDNNLIINDTYSLDLDSLKLSLEYQIAKADGRSRVVIIGLQEKESARKEAIMKMVKEFEPIELHFYSPSKPLEWNFKDTCMLLKGSREMKMESLVKRLRQKFHQTYLEIDLSAIRHNIGVFKSRLLPDTKMLCMVKAASYGSDAKAMGKFLQDSGIHYLGVAYVDEGIELRRAGVTLPILVMNTEEGSFDACIENNLEPVFFNLALLDRFVHLLIDSSIEGYPIHIKLETGMNRLGFNHTEISELIAYIKGQPEVYIRSIYSHLAEADVIDSPFTKTQIERFNLMCDQFENEFKTPFLRHLLNSSGITNYPEAQFDMVRLGIGMYGVNNDPYLRPAIQWVSSISQIKEVKAGESVGYNRSFVADKDTRIAVIPVGYADGFSRSLSNGKGSVFIDGKQCDVVGNVCMDMIMVEIGNLSANAGDKVEIIGPHQPVQSFASKLNTISYEVMTGFSSRIHRVYIEN